MTHKLITQLFLTLSLLVLLPGCTGDYGFKTLGGAEYGVLFYKLPVWLGGGIRQHLLVPGEKEFIWPWEELYVLDTSLQTIGWGGAGQGDRTQEEDYVQTRALDGNEVGLAVTVKYRLNKDRAAYLISNVGDTNDKIRQLVAAVAHADIRTQMNTLNTWDFANQHERQRAVAAVKSAMNTRLEREGVIVEEVIYNDHRFERALGDGTYDRSYQEKIDQTQATNQETQQEQKKIAAVVEDKKRLFNEEQARVNRVVREAEGRKQQAALRGNAFLESKKIESGQILVVGQAEVEGLRKRIEALSGPGGEALLKTELVDHLTKNNPKFVILNTSNQAAGSVDLMRIDANDLLSRAGALSALSAGNDEKTAPKPAEPVAK